MAARWSRRSSESRRPRRRSGWAVELAGQVAERVRARRAPAAPRCTSARDRRSRTCARRSPRRGSRVSSRYSRVASPLASRSLRASHWPLRSSIGPRSDRRAIAMTAGLSGAVAEPLGLDHLPPAGADGEDRERAGDGDAGPEDVRADRARAAPDADVAVDGACAGRPLMPRAPPEPEAAEPAAAVARRPAAAPAPRSERASRRPTTSAFASSEEPPYEMNGSVMPVSGISLRLPAAMMNAWTPMTSARPAASSDRNSSCAGRGDAQPARDQHEVQPQDGEQADQPQLLADRGERVVGVDGRDRQAPADRRQAGAQAHPQDPAAPEGVQRLDHLEAGALRVGPRVEPVVDAGLDVAEQVVQDEGAGDEQQRARR